MEVPGVIFRPLPCFSGAGLDTQSSNLSFSSASFNVGELRVMGCKGGSKIACVRPEKASGYSGFGFTDKGHLQYHVSPKSSLKKEKKKDSEKASIKKKLKLVKGLSKDLLMFSSMGFGMEAQDGLITEVKEKKISEAADVLLAQLQQLRMEEKEIKRKRKQEKAKLKTAPKGTGVVREESSSSFSESNNGEGGEIINMSFLRSEAAMETKSNEPQLAILEDATLASPSLMIQEQRVFQVERIKDQNVRSFENESCTRSIASCSNGRSIGESSVKVAPSANRIEVCMGGKCKKAGAPALLEEFEKRVGQEGVVGCKCMGKCRNGPNVRVLNQCNEGVAEKNDGSVGLHAAKPLCVGVGLEDVSVIVANFFGEARKDLDLMAA